MSREEDEMREWGHEEGERTMMAFEEFTEELCCVLCA